MMGDEDLDQCHWDMQLGFSLTAGPKLPVEKIRN